MRSHICWFLFFKVNLSQFPSLKYSGMKMLVLGPGNQTPSPDFDEQSGTWSSSHHIITIIHLFYCPSPSNRTHEPYRSSSSTLRGGLISAKRSLKQKSLQLTNNKHRAGVCISLCLNTVIPPSPFHFQTALVSPSSCLNWDRSTRRSLQGETDDH